MLAESNHPHLQQTEQVSSFWATRLLGLKHACLTCSSDSVLKNILTADRRRWAASRRPGELPETAES